MNFTIYKILNIDFSNFEKFDLKHIFSLWRKACVLVGMLLSSLTWCEMTLVLIKKTSLSLVLVLVVYVLGGWRLKLVRWSEVEEVAREVASEAACADQYLAPFFLAAPCPCLNYRVGEEANLRRTPGCAVFEICGERGAARHLARAYAPAAPRDMHANWRRQLCMCTPSRLQELITRSHKHTDSDIQFK